MYLVPLSCILKKGRESVRNRMETLVGSTRPYLTEEENESSGGYM